MLAVLAVLEVLAVLAVMAVLAVPLCLCFGGLLREERVLVFMATHGHSPLALYAIGVGGSRAAGQGSSKPRIRFEFPKRTGLAAAWI